MKDRIEELAKEFYMMLVKANLNSMYLDGCSDDAISTQVARMDLIAKIASHAFTYDKNLDDTELDGSKPQTCWRCGAKTKPSMVFKNARECHYCLMTQYDEKATPAPCQKCGGPTIPGFPPHEERPKHSCNMTRFCINKKCEHAFDIWIDVDDKNKRA